MSANQLASVSGVDSYLLYGEETTFADGTAPTNHFGIVKSVNPTSRRNLMKHYGMKGSSSGGKNWIKVTGGRFEGSMTVEFEPQVWTWLQQVLMNDRTGSGTSGDPYSYTEGNTLKTVSISHALDKTTTDRESKYGGCIINSCTIKATQGEPITVSLDIMHGNEDKDASLVSNQNLSTSTPYTFVGGTLEYPDTNALSHTIDSAEITITNNGEFRYGLGAYEAVAGVTKTREYIIKITIDQYDEEFIDDFLGSATAVSAPTTAATMALKFTDGANKYVDFVFTSVYIDEFGVGATANEVLTEDITFTAQSLVVGEQTAA